MQLNNQTFPAGVEYHPTWNIIDASKLSVLMRCEREFFFRHVLGWQIVAPNHDLVFGQAVHHAMDVLLRSGLTHDSVGPAYDAFIKYYRRFYGPQTDGDHRYKSPGNAQVMLEAYVDNYRRTDAEDVITQTEIFGQLPYNEVDMIAFKMDVIFHNPYKFGGRYAMYEHKTASALYSYWEPSWFLKIQPHLYNVALAQYFGGENVFGTFINGLVMTKTPNFSRVPVEYDERFAEAFLNELAVHMSMLEQHFDLLSQDNARNNYMRSFPKRESGCVRYQRMCEYCGICSTASNPLRQIGNPPVGFVREFWDPRSTASENATFVQLAPLKKIEHVEEQRPAEPKDLRSGYDAYLRKTAR